MGVDYCKSRYIGFKINRAWNDNTAELVRQNVVNDVLVNHYEYLMFEEQTLNIEFGRLNEFTTRDRITNETIYPKRYMKKITREQFKKDIKFNARETEFIERFKELIIDLDFEYFEIAELLY